MAKDYLLEIGMEEIPARFLISLSQQLQSRMESFLDEQRLNYSRVEVYATPRRLAIIVREMSPHQADQVEVLKGPALKIAQDESGQWTKAAEGFARGKGYTTDDLTIDEIKGESYVFLKHETKGLLAEEVLKNVIEIIEDMEFPVSMHWHDYSFSFIRPIHWFVSLLDDTIVPFEFLNITAGRKSQGHRTLGNAVDIESVSTYVEQLKQEGVLVDIDERQSIIRQQIEAIANEQAWSIPIDEDLLEEVTCIVEWPTALYASFDAKYLKIPKEISVTAMRDHQRYFYVEDKITGDLLPYFVTVRNGNEDHIENVAKGNKKVLHARLEDALFFYENDINRSLDDYVEKLNTVNEHFKLGTYADKQQRVGQLVTQLGDVLSVDETVITTAKDAASIYKFDLMTETVGEFPELQGTIGALYAKQFGQKDAICQAIKTQYLPKQTGGELPSTKAGALLALADKLDTLIGYFNVGLKPTGSNDPYALRRQAIGVLEILLANEWHFDLATFLSEHIENTTHHDELVSFFKDRLHQHLSSVGVDYDIINAVQKASHLDMVYLTQFAILIQVMKKVQPQDYRQMIEALTRVTNLGVTVNEKNPLDLSLAQSSSEKQLMNSINLLTIDKTNPEVQLSNFQLLINPIAVYFENNMVNAEETTIRDNRYATMKHLTDYILYNFDPREIISKF